MITIESALTTLQAAYPDAGWQHSYMGHDVLIGIVRGFPLCCWSIDGDWRVRRHLSVMKALVITRVGPVAAVEMWVEKELPLEVPC